MLSLMVRFVALAKVAKKPELDPLVKERLLRYGMRTAAKRS